jgi:hypothetical protein
LTLFSSEGKREGWQGRQADKREPRNMERLIKGDG